MSKYKDLMTSYYGYTKPDNSWLPVKPHKPYDASCNINLTEAELSALSAMPMPTVEAYLVEQGATEVYDDNGDLIYRCGNCSEWNYVQDLSLLPIPRTDWNFRVVGTCCHIITDL